MLQFAAGGADAEDEGQRTGGVHEAGEVGDEVLSQHLPGGGFFEGVELVEDEEQAAVADDLAELREELVLEEGCTLKPDSLLVFFQA